MLLILELTTDKIINDIVDSSNFARPHSFFDNNTYKQFATQSPTFWNDISNQKRFIDEIGKHLNITNKEEWYKLTSATLVQYGGSQLLEKFNGSLSKLLSHVYPEYP